MYPLRSDVDLNLIIKKLGHDVEEIRLRTLKNLLSKLELNVIHETDLVQERSLLVKLLEWFNFPSCSMKIEVLQLIKTLSEHASASELLIGIGAVEFLSELRQDCDPSLHSDIDQILENLFKLPKDNKISSPEEKSQRYDSEKCHYYYQKTKEGESGSSPCVIQDPIFDSPLSYFPPEIKDRKSSLQEQPMGSSVSLGGMRGVIFSTFPWLVLTATDKHVLSSTNNSLCSSRQDVVKTSCDFLCDVVLQDFPGEILLQRPQIIRSLLSILDLRPPQLEDESLILKALKCFSDLSQYLCERYHFYHDPDLYCPKQEFGVSQMSNGSSSHDMPSQSTSQSNLSSNSRPSVIGYQGPRVDGDGKDWDTPSSDSPSMRSPVSDADSEDAVSLQFSQVTLPQFCLDVLLRTLSVYQDFTGLDVSSSALPLVWRVLRLIKLSMSSEIWSETGLSGRALIDKLNDSFELLADILIQSNYQLQEINEPTEAANRYLSYVSLIAVTVELTVGLVPHSLSSSVLPESLLAALYQVVVNPFVSECLPDIRPLLLPYLKNGNVQLLKNYEQCEMICEAIIHAAEFLILYQEGGDITNLISMGELSLPALSFPETVPVVEKFVLTCSSLGADSNDPDETEKIISKFLLNTSTAGHTLKTSQSIVEESLNISQAKDPLCLASRKVKFLLHPSILKSVAGHLSSHHVEMKESALSILLHLLTGRLLMTREIWNQFITACGPSLALIQAHSFKNATLQHALRALLVIHDYDQETKSLTHLQQLKLCLRFLFMKDIRDRTDLARIVLKYLEDEKGSESKLPRRALIIPEQISLLFLIEKTLPLQEDIGRSVFQVESVVQMFRIFMSSDTDESLRKSSAEQLGVILQDHSLHQAFINEGGVEAVLENMNSYLEKRKDSQRAAGFLAACGRILRLVVHNSPKLRHELSGQMSVYLTAIRCGLICLQDDQAREDFCHLVILLIFDEIAGTIVSDEGAEDKFCLPSPVNNGYQLPFAVQTLRKSDASTDHPEFLEDDPLALQAVKVSWALGVHQRCDRLSKVLMAGLDPEDSPSLALSEIEQNLLLHSHQASAVKVILKGIRTATSHYGVKQSLWQLTHWLSLEKFTSRRDKTSEISRSVCVDMVKEDLFGALQRFFEVTPTNQDDEVLLREILHFLTVFLRSCPDSTNQMFTNLKSQMMKDTAPMLELLGQSAQIKPMIEGSAAGPDKNNRKSGLLKQVLEFVSVFVQTLDRSSEAWMIHGHFIGSSLVSKLLYGLHLADEFHYYDLPSLEATLICLMHITARSGWSLDWSDGDSYTLCQQMLRSLLEVVSAFHIGRGGIAISFMGKGVTRNASICLLQLSHEMRARAPDKSWPSHWVHEIPGSMSSGLQWLVPLWSYRDPEVRASGLGIAVNLASTVQGCSHLSKCQEDLPGSLWTKILTIITDHSECSMVRKQAVNLLINLLSHPMNRSNKDEPSSDGEWIGPNLVNEETQVSGEAAVLSLLSSFSLVPHTITILSYFYPQCSIQPVSVVDNSSAGSTQSASGPSTMTTPDILDNIPSGQVSQPANGHQVISPVLSEHSSTVPLIAASFQTDGPQPSSLSSEGTIVEPRAERAPSATGYPSVVTPCLVASVSSLLNQLSVLFSDSYILSKGKTEILKLITGIVDPNKAQNLLSSSSSLAAIQYLQMCTKCLELITIWIDKDQDLTKMISRTCQLLHVQHEKIKDQAVKVYLHCLIESCFNFLSACIQRGKETEVLEISSHHWIHVTATVNYLMKYSLSCSVRSSSFVFLAHILSLNVVANPLTAALEAKQEDGRTQGSILCDLLLSAYEETAPPCLNHISQEKNGLVAALKNLSSRSLSAKQAALDAGIVETLIEDMKRCHAKLSAESLLPVNKRNKKKKNVTVQQEEKLSRANSLQENGLLREIKIILVILQNLMYENQDVKVAVKQGGLAQVLCKLWGYIQSNKSLQTSVLSTLTVYTSRCLSACLSLIRSSSGEISGTIFHYLMKLASHDPPEQRVFEVMTNCLWCDECRNIIWKNGLLSNLGKFQSLSCKSKKSQQSVQAIRLWLKLLVVFTFSPDGQQMAMKVKDILELLMELVKSSQADISHLALIVIHNLCFLGPNKNKLLSNEHLLPVLLAKFDNGDLQDQFVVTSALWSTLHGNQKVKAKLKAHNLQVRTREALANLKKDIQKPLSDQEVEGLMVRHESALTCLLQSLLD